MDFEVNRMAFCLLFLWLLCVALGIVLIGPDANHGHDGTTKQIVANSVQTSLQTGQRLKEVRDRVDRSYMYIYSYGLYSTEYAGEASVGEP